MSELRFEYEPLPSYRGLRCALSRGGAALSFAEVLEAWRDEPSFCARFGAELAACDYEAFFFETPPLRVDTRARAFEFVLIDAPSLAARRADPRPFSEPLAAAEQAAQLVTSFANLRGDATLIVPCARDADCTHLATFSRSASAEQQRALWAASAEATLAALGAAPRWLSTSGLGVSWLHLRVDSRPKYYSYRPYARG